MAWTSTPDLGSRGSISASGALVLAVALAILATIAGVAAAQAAGSTDPAHSRSLVNSVRVSAGLASLVPDGGLDTVARAQAKRMADRDMIFHDPDLGAHADAAGVAWTLIGENVGVGSDVDAVHDAFMASPAHRANITHRAYTHIGVGTAVGRDGSVFVAHAFAQVEAARPAPAAPTPAPTTPGAVPAPVSQPASSASPVAPAPAAVTPAPALQPVDLTVPNALLGGIVNR